jgi:PAS domain S-box-containing protein
VHIETIASENGQQCRAVMTDITERKQAEEALRESEVLFRKLFEDHSAVKLILDPDTGNIVDANEAAAVFYGWSREQLKQMKIQGINTLPPEEVKKEMEKVRAQKRIYFEFRHRRADGSVRDVGVFSSKIETNKRDLLHSIVYDITDRKQAEKEILRLNAELEKDVAERTKELHDSQLALLNLVDDLNQSAKNIALANQALAATNKELEAFSYSVSHDLRAPLRGMDGFSKTLLEDYSDKLDATGKNYLERIRAGTQRMGSLIDDMLKLSQVTRVEFKRESVDLSKMVRTILLTVRRNNPARDVKVSIQKDIIIDGDRHLLEIALTNLIDNAWKFTGKTKNARIEFGTLLKDGKPVIFIRDNGVGFDMAYVDKLFGAFQRLHTTAEFPGTGIGLATVQRVIHRHGGKIWAEGEVGKGATFFFTIP